MERNFCDAHKEATIPDTVECAECKIRRQYRELESFKKDAERYRWFRKNMANGNDPYTCEWVTQEGQLDEYIDENMKKDKS